MSRSIKLQTVVTNYLILGLGLVTSILLARTLGPEGRGEVTAIMLWPVLLAQLGSLGVASATLYYSASPDMKLENLIPNTFLLMSVQSVVLIPLGYWCMTYLLSSQTKQVIDISRLYLYVIPISLITQYGLAIIQGRLHITVFNYLRLIIPIGYFFGIASYSILGYLKLENIIVLNFALNAATMFGLLIALKQKFTLDKLFIDFTQINKILRYGLKVQFGDISRLANLRLDQALIAAFLPAFQLGLYITAVSASSIAIVFASAVRMVITPQIAQKEIVEEQRMILQTAFRQYWLYSIPLIGLLVLVLPFLIPFVFGEEFVNSVWPAEILLLAALFLGGKEVLSGGVQGLGDPWLASRSELISLTVTLIGLFLLLPSLGIMGAAIATLLAYSVALIFLVWGLAHSHDIKPSSLFSFTWNDLLIARHDAVDLVSRLRTGQKK